MSVVVQVDCKPFRASYEGRWDAMVSKCAKCVLKLLEIAKGRRRNFILDQVRKTHTTHREINFIRQQHLFRNNRDRISGINLPF